MTGRVWIFLRARSFFHACAARTPGRTKANARAVFLLSTVRQVIRGGILR
jgi:hypothetical protein